MEIGTNAEVTSSEELKKTIKTAISVDQPILILGDAGLGKSDIAQQAANEMGYQSLVYLAGNVPPEDFTGIAMPDLSTGEVKRLKPDIITAVEKARDNGKPVMLFLDELSNASQVVQAALYTLVLDRQLAGYTLPQDTRIVAAGNHIGTGPANLIASPLLDRFFVFDFKGASPQEYIDYFKTKQLHPVLFKYLIDNPDDILKSTPRKWMKLSSVLNNMTEDRIMFSSFAQSALGYECALSLESFYDQMGKYPSFSQMIDGTGAVERGNLGAEYVAISIISNSIMSVNLSEPEKINLADFITSLGKNSIALLQIWCSESLEKLTALSRVMMVNESESRREVISDTIETQKMVKNYG